MKYGEASTVCSTPECGKERVKGQRYCRECRVEAQRQYRQRRKEYVAWLEKMAAQAQSVARQIEQFNRTGGTAA
jgi:hypothetical protein